jgi:apolipoprotein N-acyltransferase
MAKKIGWITAFLLGGLWWVATITHDTVGFVAPVNAEAVGFDIATLLSCLLFIYTGREQYRSSKTSSRAGAK